MKIDQCQYCKFLTVQINFYNERHYFCLKYFCLINCVKMCNQMEEK